MSKPSKADTWMPFYIADYLRKTMHLNRDQHGGYMLLIMACWDRGGRLPNDPSQLAGIVRATPSEWKRLAPVLLPFFEVDGDLLIQSRVIAEHEKAARLSEARRESGRQGGRPRKQTESEQKPIGFDEHKQSETPASVRSSPSPSPSPNGEVSEAIASSGPLSAIAARPESEKPPPNSRGTRLPPDWAPGFAEIEYAGTKGLDHEEITRVAEDFRDYWIAKPGADGRKADWPSTWRTWIRSHIDRRRPVASRPGQPRGGGQGATDFASIVAQRRGFDAA